MQPSAGTAFAHFGGLVDELDCINVSENAAGLSRRLTCDLCEKEDPVYGCHGCDARFCRTCCVRLHSDAIIEDHVLTRLTAANTAANSNAEMSEDSAIFKISGDAPSLDSKKMACLDVHTRLGQSLFALQGCASAAQSLDSQIDEFSLIISRARCDAEDQARRDFDFVLSALSRRESQLMQHLQRLLQAKSARLSDYIEELDLRTKRLSDFLAAMNDSTLNDSALRESATLLERMMAPTVDVAVSDSLSDLLRACKFEVEVDIGGALRSIHGISSGRGQVTESEPHTSDSSFPSDTPFTATPTAHFAAKNISLSDAKPSSAQLDSPALSVSIGSRESAPASRDVSTPYVKSGSTGDRLILGGRPCTGALMEQLLHTLTSHHNLTSIDVTSSALGDAGALALASASLSCSHLCVLGMSQNNIGPEGASAIADAVTLHRSIHSLFLSSNNIGSDGAVSIARIVMASTSLTALNLKSNRIGSEGTQSIAASLSRNNHLISLDLWNNDVGERGAGAISEALSINTTLQELDLGSNAILDSGFLVVVNALGSSSLVKLLCRVNQIGLLGVQGLVAAIPKLHRLRELHLWGNDLTSSGDELLTEACATMPALRILR